MENGGSPQIHSLVIIESTVLNPHAPPSPPLPPSVRWGTCLLSHLCSPTAASMLEPPQQLKPSPMILLYKEKENSAEMLIFGLRF